LKKKLARGAPSSAGLLFFVMVGCGDHGVFPTTVDQGQDFNFAEVVFDESFYYCRVEPVLIEHGCGPGGAGDPQGGCHSNVTSFRFVDYGPPIAADDCDGLAAPSTISPVAQQNYQAAQARMKRDPEVASLLQRPTGAAAHPRVIFAANSSEADVIREWATRFSSQ
jgi:hypothetical protein